jgi:hypothetical protein
MARNSVRKKCVIKILETETAKRNVQYFVESSEEELHNSAAAASAEAAGEEVVVEEAAAGAVDIPLGNE